MTASYQPERTDLAGWRIKVGEDNHGQHKWLYLPEGPARDAWPQTMEDKYWLGLEVVRWDVSFALLINRCARGDVYSHLPSSC
jgi:hypothetical protein